jgi:hypothetical protein
MEEVSQNLERQYLQCRVIDFQLIYFGWRENVERILFLQKVEEIVHHNVAVV